MIIIPAAAWLKTAPNREVLGEDSRWARSRKSTVSPPLAPLTTIVTCSLPPGGVSMSHLPSTPSHQQKSRSRYRRGGRSCGPTER